MLPPDDPDARDLVTAIVRDIATDSSHPTLVRIGVAPIGPYAVREPFTHHPDLDRGRFLLAAAAAERQTPLGLPAGAYALILPDRHIAYIKHGPGAISTVAVGANPIDDPDTHRDVEAGLAAFMQAVDDTAPEHRPSGHAFPPGEGVTTAPDLPPVNGHQHHPRNGTAGPHR